MAKGKIADDSGWRSKWSRAKKRTIHGRKETRFWDNIAARDRCLSRACCRGRSAGADRGYGIYAPQKNTPNRSSVAHILNYMKHTPAIERIFNA